MESLRSAANDCSARNSCTNPRIALSNTIARMAPASIQSSSRPDTAAAPIRTQMMRLENCRKKIFSGEGRAASGSSFGPTVAKRRRASGVLSPISLSDWSSCLSCSSLSVCHVFVIVMLCSCVRQSVRSGQPRKRAPRGPTASLHAIALHGVLVPTPRLPLLLSRNSGQWPDNGRHVASAPFFHAAPNASRSTQP